MFAMQYGHILRITINCSVLVILSAFAKIHYKLTLSLYCTPVTCFLRENVGVSEKRAGCDVGRVALKRTG